MTDQRNSHPSAIGALVRLYWMFGGTALLLFILVFLLQEHPNKLAPLDAVYFVVTASLILVRYIDIRFLNGETGEGKPATMINWRRYAILVGSVAVGAWMLARMFTYVLK